MAAAVALVALARAFSTGPRARFLPSSFAMRFSCVFVAGAHEAIVLSKSLDQSTRCCTRQASTRRGLSLSNEPLTM